MEHAARRNHADESDGRDGQPSGIALGNVRESRAVSEEEVRGAKPIRVFYSELSQRFYASRAYKQVKPGIVEITGQKFDVTDDIARLVIRHDIEFTKVEEPDGRDG